MSVNSPIAVARQAPQLEVEMTTNEDARFEEHLTRYDEIRNKYYYYVSLELWNALIDHSWEQ